LVFLLRAKYLVPAEPYNQVRGRPFTTSELIEAFKKHL